MEGLYIGVPTAILMAAIGVLLRRYAKGDNVRGLLTEAGEELMRRGEHEKPLELSHPKD